MYISRVKLSYGEWSWVRRVDTLEKSKNHRYQYEIQVFEVTELIGDSPNATKTQQNEHSVV